MRSSSSVIASTSIVPILRIQSHGSYLGIRVRDFPWPSWVQLASYSISAWRIWISLIPMTSIWRIGNSLSIWSWPPSIVAIDLAIDVTIGKLSFETHIVFQENIVHGVLTSLIGLAAKIIVESVSALVLADCFLIWCMFSALMKLLLQLAMFKLMTSL